MIKRDKCPKFSIAAPLHTGTGQNLRTDSASAMYTSSVLILVVSTSICGNQVSLGTSRLPKLKISCFIHYVPAYFLIHKVLLNIHFQIGYYYKLCKQMLFIFETMRVSRFAFRHKVILARPSSASTNLHELCSMMYCVNFVP